MKNPGIYILTNRTNNKKYVGMDSNLPSRISKHFRGHSACPAIHNAIKKYGKDSFSIEIIPYPGISNKALSTIEKWKITNLHTKYPNGYNLTDGGEGCFGREATQEMRNKLAEHQRGKTHTKASREKMSKAKKDKPLSDEHKQSLSKFNSYEFLGKKHTDKTKKSISIAVKKAKMRKKIR